MKTALSALAAFFAVSALTATTACSPSMFGDAKDTALAKWKNLREAHVECDGLDLSSARMNVKQFRGLVKCFNANGIIEPLYRLVEKMTDEQLKPTVDLTNKYLMDNKSMLFKIDETMTTLDEKGLLDETFKQFGKLLENREFVTSGIALARETYYGGATPAANGQRNDEILRAIERVSQKLGPESVASTLDIAITAGESKVFSSLLRHFSTKQRVAERAEGSPARMSLRDLVYSAVEYTKYARKATDPAVGIPHDHVRTLIQAALDGKLLPAMDSVVGTSIDELRGVPGTNKGIARISAVLRATLANGGRDMQDITSLFHITNRPVHCMRGTRVIENAALHVVKEITLRDPVEAPKFMKRDNKLKLAASIPFCDLPKEVDQYYGGLWRLADTTAAPAAAEFFAAFYNHGLADTLVKLLADTGDDGLDKGGIKLVIPLLAELTDRGIWDDLFLAINLPKIEDRPAVFDAIRFLLDSRDPRLQGRSLYDIAMETTANANPDRLYDVLYAARDLVDPDKPALLLPALKALRSAYYVNDVHPIVEILHDVISHSTENRPLIEALMATSQTPEFTAALEFLSQITKPEDGRLKQLLAKILTLFRRYARDGQTLAIHPAAEPPITLVRRHNLDETDLVPFPIVNEPYRADGCGRLSLKFSLSDYTNGAWRSELNNLAECINADGYHTDVVSMINDFADLKTNDGRCFVGWQIDLMTILANGYQPDLNAYPGLSKAEVADILQRWLTSLDDGRFDRALKAVQFLAPRAEDGRPMVLRPLFDLIDPIVNGLRAQLDRLQAFGARYLVSNDVPYLLRYAEALWKLKPKPEQQVNQTNFDLTRIARWVGNKECEVNPGKQWQRTAEIIDDYNNSVTSWEWRDWTNKGQKTGRREWSFQEFKDYAKGLIDKFGDKKWGSPLLGSLKLLRYFSRTPQAPEQPKDLFTVARSAEEARKRGFTPTQHFTLDELLHFFKDMANDFRFITYFYAGEDKPRVRLVNSLDRLELVVINADFMAPPPFGKNYGQKFLADIGMAWGDEPREAWPQLIQDMYPRGGKKRPPTLREAYEGIASKQGQFEFLMAFPDLPGCRQYANPHDPKNVQEYETSDPQAPTNGLPSWLPLPDVKPKIIEPCKLYGKDCLEKIPLEDMRRHLWNIRQTLSVVEELLPDSGGPHAGKLRVLRDMFFELYTSGRNEWRTPKHGWGNNLSVVIKLVRMGVTRQIGRIMKNVDINDPSVRDFFQMFIDSAIQLTSQPGPMAVPTDINPAAGQDPDDTHSPALFKVLFENKNDPDKSLLWGTIERIWGILDASVAPDQADRAHSEEISGKPYHEVREIKEGWKDETAYLKQLSFYSLSMAQRLGIREKLIDIAPSLLNEHFGYLSGNLDSLEDMLRSQRASQLTRAVYEDILKETLQSPGTGPENRSLCPLPGPSAMSTHLSLSPSCRAMLGNFVNDALTPGSDKTTIASDGLKLVATIDGTPKHKASWRAFRDRYDGLKNVAEWNALNLDELLDQTFDFFKEIPPSDYDWTNPNQVNLSWKIRKYAALTMTQHASTPGTELDQLLTLIAGDAQHPQNPDKFYHSLSVLGRYGANGEIKDFMDIIKRALENGR